jgi:DNA replicative helicase MCM subunit Mcm2 (Cdc46/Mcm family)
MFSMFYKNLNKRKEKSAQREEPEHKMAKCGSTKYTPVEEKKICVDYQELRLQEQFKHITAGKLPQTLSIVV